MSNTTKIEPGFYNMDCKQAMKEFPDRFFDLAIVDPPYGFDPINAPSRIEKYGLTEETSGSIPDESYFKELFRVSKNQIIWGGNYFDLPPTRGFIFWHKHQPVKSYAAGEYAWTSFDRNAKCFDYPFFGSVGAEKDRCHPHQKPIVLYRWLLENYAEEGDKILDTHVGSASSLIACMEMGFSFWGYENDLEHYNSACKRIAKAKALIAARSEDEILLAGGQKSLFDAGME